MIKPRVAWFFQPKPAKKRVLGLLGGFLYRYISIYIYVYVYNIRVSVRLGSSTTNLGGLTGLTPVGSRCLLATIPPPNMEGDATAWKRIQQEFSDALTSAGLDVDNVGRESIG